MLACVVWAVWRPHRVEPVAMFQRVSAVALGVCFDRRLHYESHNNSAAAFWDFIRGALSRRISSLSVHLPIVNFQSRIISRCSTHQLINPSRFRQYSRPKETDDKVINSAVVSFPLKVDGADDKASSPWSNLDLARQDRAQHVGVTFDF